MSLLAVIGIVLLVYRALGFVNKYTRLTIPEPVLDFAPIITACAFAWENWAEAGGLAILIIAALNVLDVGRDSIILYYMTKVSGGRR